jgi:hypothetical protein
MRTQPLRRPLESPIDNSRVRAVHSEGFTLDAETPMYRSDSGRRSYVDVLELDVARRTFETNDRRYDLASRMSSHIGDGNIRDVCDRLGLNAPQG